VEESKSWERLLRRDLSRRRLMTGAASLGTGLAVLSLVGCEDKKDKKEVARVSPTISPSPAISLPDPRLRGEVSLEEAILERRSKREFDRSPLTLDQVSQILWAAQGITEEGGLRAAPSAGALYPLDVYLVAGRDAVEGLTEGVYHYLPQGHSLERVLERDVRRDLARYSVEQMFIADAPVTLVITAEYERTTQKYGERGVRYVHMEAGHAAENVYLQAEALGLGTVAVGAFGDTRVAQLLDLPSAYEPLYVMPIAHPKS
jgi:SagB-type dehydrogenase family enzyme